MSSDDKSGDSDDGLNGDIKTEPDTGSSIYTDLQKALPGSNIMSSLDMQTGNAHNAHNPHNAHNAHNAHAQHQMSSMNNGSSHHHDMGQILQEYQTLWQ